jgi:hypothetical protein
VNEYTATVSAGSARKVLLTDIPQGSAKSVVSSKTSWTLFEEPIWLNCVAPGAWGAVDVREGGEIVGRLP